jgi:hypothetical protein
LYPNQATEKDGTGVIPDKGNLIASVTCDLVLSA